MLKFTFAITCGSYTHTNVVNTLFGVSDYCAQNILNIYRRVLNDETITSTFVEFLRRGFRAWSGVRHLPEGCASVMETMSILPLYIGVNVML